MKKTLLALIAATLVLALAACGGKADSSSQPAAPESTAAPASSKAPASVAAESKSTPASEAEESQPAAGDVDIEATLTPDSAEVSISSEGAMILESDQSLDELKAFYEGALKTLGAKQTTVSEVMGWEYTGTYDGDKPIVIAITDMMEEGTYTITIAY